MNRRRMAENYDEESNTEDTRSESDSQESDSESTESESETQSETQPESEVTSSEETEEEENRAQRTSKQPNTGTVLSRFVEKKERLAQSTTKHEKTYFLPKQVMYHESRSTLIKDLALAAAKNDNSDIFALNSVIIEYLPHLFGKEESFSYAKTAYTYSYLTTYVPVCIPAKRYNWFIREAERLTGRRIKRNSLSETSEYVWIIAEVDQRRSIECYVYTVKSNNVQCVGYLPEKLFDLKSNVIGVGHFKVSVYQSRDLSICYLKFTLFRFQLVDKVAKPIAPIPFIKVQPSTEIMKLLK